MLTQVEVDNNYVKARTNPPSRQRGSRQLLLSEGEGRDKGRKVGGGGDEGIVGCRGYCGLFGGFGGFEYLSDGGRCMSRASVAMMKDVDSWLRNFRPA